MIGDILRRLAEAGELFLVRRNHHKLKVLHAMQPDAMRLFGQPLDQFNPAVQLPAFRALIRRQRCGGADADGLEPRGVDSIFRAKPVDDRAGPRL